MQWQLTGSGSLQKHAWNQQPIDFIRSLKNSIHARIPVIALDGILRAVTVAAIYLHCFVDGKIEDLAAEDFEHRTFDRVLFDCLQYLQGVVDIDSFERPVHQSRSPVDHALRHPDAD